MRTLSVEAYVWGTLIGQTSGQFLRESMQSLNHLLNGRFLGVRWTFPLWHSRGEGFRKKGSGHCPHRHRAGYIPGSHDIGAGHKSDSHASQAAWAAHFG